MYKQVRPFNQNKGGSAKGWCLRNVRLGYDIGSKYASAWEAWQNTKQFTTPIPTGVSVPIFFWWGKYGHIGVQLPDGRFWTDGVIWSSLTRYRLTHPTIVYRGWSTHLNGVEVIKNAPQSKMPAVGQRVQFTIPRTAFKAGTTTVAGTLAPDTRWVRGYDPKYPNRILVNSAAVGNGVAVALYYTSGAKIDGWTIK
jgi:hypothetical protein